MDLHIYLTIRFFSAYNANGFTYMKKSIKIIKRTDKLVGLPWLDKTPSRSTRHCVAARGVATAVIARPSLRLPCPRPRP